MYLRDKDYSALIQPENLNQIISNDSSLKKVFALVAQEELASYLRQKYLIAQEFTDTEVFSMSKSYKARDRVELNFAAYSATSTYAINDLVINAGKAYVCITAITVAEAFNIAKWTLLGNQYDLFYVTLPVEEFNSNKIYNRGDLVFWNDKVYTNVQPTFVPDHEAILQYGSTSNIPQLNTFPDDPVNGSKVWGTGTAYSVDAGTLVTDTDFWTAGDNRSPQIVMYMIDVLLYHIHARIPPRNIPQERHVRYEAAKAWLEMAARGDITANIPLIQPKQGRRITSGGRIKNQNHY